MQTLFPAKAVTVPAQKTKHFDAFYLAYPRKMKKGDARKAWSQMGCDSFPDQVMQGLERCKQSRDWQSREGKYLPYPASWLRAEGWEDEPDSGDPRAATQATAAAWDSLTTQTKQELLDEVRRREPGTMHMAGNMDTQRAMRRLARERGLI